MKQGTILSIWVVSIWAILALGLVVALPLLDMSFLLVFLKVYLSLPREITKKFHD